MRGLSIIFSFIFRNEINKFNNVRFYLSHDIKITMKSHFSVKIYNIVIMYATLLWTS